MSAIRLPPPDDHRRDSGKAPRLQAANRPAPDGDKSPAS